MTQTVLLIISASVQTKSLTLNFQYLNLYVHGFQQLINILIYFEQEIRYTLWLSM